MFGNMMRCAIQASGARILLFAMFAAAAQANITVWSNGNFYDDGGFCDTQNPCGGGTDYIIADQFILGAPAVITGFSYYDFIYFGGSITDYTGSKWVISSGDPATSPSIASGLSVGTTQYGPITFTAPSGPSVLVTVTGLNVPLSAGTYWLGIGTQLANDGVWSRGAADGLVLPGWEQYTPTFEQFVNYPPGGAVSWNTAFSVQAAPEPGSLILLSLAVAGVLICRKRTRQA